MHFFSVCLHFDHLIGGRDQKFADEVRGRLGVGAFAGRSVSVKVCGRRAAIDLSLATIPRGKEPQ
jgi:hypothetical protein